MNSKLSDKDKKDWQNFILNKEPIKNKDLKIFDDTINKEAFKKIDLHGFSLDNANKVIEGNANKIKTVNDVWKFSKNMWSDNPSWYLVETQA